MEYCELWSGGPRLETGCGAEPVCTDSIMLSAFPSLSGVRRAADFGCGSGIIAILLAQRSANIHIDCVELSACAAAVARRNIEENGLSDRLCVLERDLRSLREAEVGKYQLIVSNPPYFPVGSGTAPSSERQAAREERFCTLTELAAAASRLLGDGGRLALVYPTERLSEALCTLSSHALEPKRLRLVQARGDTPPSVALVECRRGGRSGLRVDPVLIIKAPDGSDTDEARSIYHL